MRLDELPSELLVGILWYMDVNEAMMCMRVCRWMRGLLRTSHHLFRAILLPPEWINPMVADVDIRSMRRHGLDGSVRKVALYGDTLPSGGFGALLEAFPQLREIAIWEHGISCSEIVRAMMEKRPQHLSHLQIRTYQPVDDAYFKQLKSKVVAVTKGKLEGLSIGDLRWPVDLAEILPVQSKTAEAQRKEVNWRLMWLSKIMTGDGRRPGVFKGATTYLQYYKI